MVTDDQKTPRQTDTKGTKQSPPAKKLAKRKALNRTLALETFALLRELAEVIREDELVMTQMADVIDRTPIRLVDNDFMNSLVHRMRERRAQLENHIRRATQMSGVLRKRLEAEGVMKSVVKKAVKNRGAIKRVPGSVKPGSKSAKTSGPTVLGVAPTTTLTPTMPGPKIATVCAVCTKPLKKSDHFARCNSDNCVYHGGCTEPLFDCPRCGDNLAAFMAYY